MDALLDEAFFAKMLLFRVFAKVALSSNGEGGRPPKGKEGADEVGGGRIGLDNSLLEKDLVLGWSQGSSQAVTWPAGWRSLALELLLQLVVVTMPFNKPS